MSVTKLFLCHPKGSATTVVAFNQNLRNITMKLSTLTPIAAVLAVSLSGMTHADTNPFSAKTVTTTTLADNHEGSCGGMKKDETVKEGMKKEDMKEGKCGGMKTVVEGKAVGMKEGKCGSHKGMKEGKCGEHKMKGHKEGKCGAKKKVAEAKIADDAKVGTEAKSSELKSTAEVKSSAVTPVKK